MENRIFVLFFFYDCLKKFIILFCEFNFDFQTEIKSVNFLEKFANENPRQFQQEQARKIPKIITHTHTQTVVKKNHSEMVFTICLTNKSEASKENYYSEI